MHRIQYAEWDWFGEFGWVVVVDYLPDFGQGFACVAQISQQSMRTLRVEKSKQSGVSGEGRKDLLPKEAEGLLSEGLRWIERNDMLHAFFAPGEYIKWTHVHFGDKVTVGKFIRFAGSEFVVAMWLPTQTSFPRTGRHATSVPNRRLLPVIL